MSLRDKIKNKVKSSSSKVQTQKMESFDQNSIIISVSEGKSQLSQIKLTCKWVNPSITYKIPQLKCTWYNKTQNNIQPIQGVQTPNYQLSIADVQTFINVQCMPSLQGVQYEGMPFMKVIGPIMLDPETDQQAKDLMQAEKATFFIQYKQIGLGNQQQNHANEGLIKIIKSQLILFAKKSLVTGNQQIFSTQINSLYPQFIINRKNSKQLNVILNENNDYATIAFGNHKLRDVFCILAKLIISKEIMSQKKREKIFENQNEIDQKTYKKQQTMTTLSEEKSQQNLAATQIKPKTEQNLQSPKKKQQTPPISPTKLPSLQKLPSSPAIHSTQQILQLSQLKQKINKLQAQSTKLKKQLQAQKQSNLGLNNKLQQNKERSANFDKNYKQLQKQVNRLKHLEGKGEEQLSYLRNQQRILKSNNQKLIKQSANLKEKLNLAENVLKKYQSKSQQKLSYEELQQKLKQMEIINKQLQMKYSQARQQTNGMEQELSKYRTQMQELECQKKYLQRKYQSLSSQITSSPSKSHISSMSKTERSIQYKSISEDDHNHGRSPELRENQLLQLKKQLKQVIDQNNYIKTLTIKQKKSSSKTQLKLELLELKKLANRLAQTLTQKQSALQNFKNINKQLNIKIIQMNKITMEQINGKSNVNE